MFTIDHVTSLIIAQGESMAKTIENLKAAFAGESQARNMYTFLAKVARKEGYHYIAELFDETAANEQRHANDHFKMLNGIGDTIANLKEAIDGENYETASINQQFFLVMEKTLC